MRFGIVAALVILVTTAFGREAEAQARGTLQATATVVDTRQGFEALAQVQQVVRSSKMQSTKSVATVAQVSSTPSATQPRTLVVTVDFSRN